MSFARELAEAVEALSIPEQIGFLETLNERVTTALHTGWFTEETMEEAWVAILRESGATEDDLDEVYEAIDEWLDEELDLLERKGAATFKKGSATAKKTPKKMPPPKKKSIGQMIADPLAKKVAGAKTKSKTGKMLKHAAAGAIRQIGKKPGSAKEILKKSAKKAGKKLLRHAVKKGMKMVFGKWLKTEHAEVLDEAVLNQEALTEAIAPKSLVPILSRASGVELDKKAGEKLAKEFVVAMRNHIESEWFDEVLQDPEVTKSKQIKTVDYEPEGAEAEVEYDMPTEIESYDAVGLGIPQIVENMPSAKRFLGHSGAIDLRRNLARALQSDLKLTKRLVEQAAQSTVRSWSAIAGEDLKSKWSTLGDMLTDLVNDSLKVYPPRGIPSEYVRGSQPYGSITGYDDVRITLKKLSADVGHRKLIKNPGGADIPILVHSVWDVRGELGIEADWDLFFNAGAEAGRDARKHGSRWHDVFG